MGFAFIYDPGIMLRGSLLDIGLATAIQVVALTLITASYAGFLIAPLGWPLRVLTAVAVHDGRRSHSALNVSHVRMGRLSDAAIASSVAGGEPFGKAGAYAIQGAMAAWIAHIDGSHSGIMGLPLHETATLLRRAGVAVP